MIGRKQRGEVKKQPAFAGCFYMLCVFCVNASSFYLTLF